MTKLLTTGEMIDTLQVGEVAVGVDGYYQETKLRMTDHHEIVYARGKSSSANNFFELNAFSHKAEWRILPRYVSFDEAMGALKEGKTVIYYINNRSRIAIDDYVMVDIFGESGVTFKEMILGNWTIESA